MITCGRCSEGQEQILTREKRKNLVLDPWVIRCTLRCDGGEVFLASRTACAQVLKWKEFVWGSEQKLVCLRQSGQGGEHSDLRVDPDQAEPKWPWGGLGILPKWRQKPERVWSSRVECHFIDMNTETQKARWFSGDYGLGSVYQGSGVWTYISVFPSDGRMQSLSLVWGGL